MASLLGAAAVRSVIMSIAPLEFVWATLDPFLFCVHHLDIFPPGTSGSEKLGVDPKLLRGRNLGSDFVVRDGFRMYHGSVVPGFPSHPHRGFETVTIARQGFIDHSDSLGARARFGNGDVQWLTAGKGIQHAEMFPLLNNAAPNPAELFQIWLNLPRADKMVDGYFSMQWSETVPVVAYRDAHGGRSQVSLIAGAFQCRQALAPPPNSWAARADSDMAIMSIRIEAGAELVLPAATFVSTNRMLYLFGGTVTITADMAGAVESDILCDKIGIRLAPLQGIRVRAGEGATADLLLLQGRPIGEPVAQRGPFVMNTDQEITQAYADYRRTEFGGWPWPSDAPVHAAAIGRFASRMVDNVEIIERPPAAVANTEL